MELCRELYNSALAERIYAWKVQHKSLSYIDQQNELPELKDAIPELRQVGSQVLQDVLRRLDKAYKSFFRHNGFPRFRGKNRYDSFTLTQASWKLDNRYLWITNLGRFKMKLSRPIQGDVKTITIRKTPTNKWYACFSCSSVPEKRLPKSGKVIGIDVGIKSFLVDSKGNKVDNPKFLIQSEKRLIRLQRKLSRRKKGSQNRKDARLILAKQHEKIAGQRLDFLHKLSSDYINNYDTIYIEDLMIQNMVRNHHLAQSITDSCWGKFFDLLSYKAEEAGREVVKVNPRNTSQICSGCGEKVEKTLADRIHACPYCGLVLDRDENAAINILAFGQNAQVLTKEVALCVA